MLDQPPALIDIRGVCRYFPKGSGEQLLVLEKVDLTIRSGEIVVDDSSDDTVKPTVSESTTVDYQV